MLRLIALGHTNAEIASQLFLSTRTVETHRAHIQQKLRRTTRAELVRYALEHNLVDSKDWKPLSRTAGDRGFETASRAARLPGMSTILIGVDATARSEDAVALARRLARLGDGDVILATVTPDRDEGHATVRRMRELLAGIEPERIRAAILPGRSAARGLHDLAVAEAAALIVVGSTHTGRLGRVRPGATGERLLLGAPCAVAVAPARLPRAARRRAHPRRRGLRRLDRGRRRVRGRRAIARATAARLQAITVIRSRSTARSRTRRRSWTRRCAKRSRGRSRTSRRPRASCSTAARGPRSRPTASSSTCCSSARAATGRRTP